MQIQFKQVEIVAALKQFIAQQGISLTGKTVDITFVAGRKEGGLTAEINIEDVTIPGTEVGDPVKPSLTLAADNTAAKGPVDTPAQEPAGEPAADAKIDTPAADKAPVNSLFGS